MSKEPGFNVELPLSFDAAGSSRTDIGRARCARANGTGRRVAGEAMRLSVYELVCIEGGAHD
jgi:hypothetical protein